MANAEYRVGGTTEVGSYPRGASPYGCFDMAGNVFEWTSSEFPDGKANRREIQANWEKMKAGRPLERIAPLESGMSMTFMPIVIRAEHRGGYRIHVTFNDNTEKTLDFTEWLHGPVFEPLKDVEYFKRFFLDGWTIAWPNGADIAPETLYEHREASEAA